MGYDLNQERAAPVTLRQDGVEGCSEVEDDEDAEVFRVGGEEEVVGGLFLCCEQNPDGNSSNRSLEVRWG